MSVDSILAKSPSVIFQPGGITGGLIVTKWAEVKTFIALRQGAVTVYIDDSLAPAIADAGTTDCQGRVVFTSFAQLENPGPPKLSLPEGAVLKDVRSIQGFLTVEAQANVTPNLLFTNRRSFSLAEGGILLNSGTAPTIRLAGGAFIVITMADSSIFSNAVAGTGSLVDMPVAGAQTVLFIVTNSGFTSDNVVTGIVGTTAIFQFDASLGVFPANPGFAGATTKFPIDDAQFVLYMPGVPGNWPVPPTEVAQALDELAARTTQETFGAIIYKPGTPTGGDHVATWPEVQSFIAQTDGKCIVYVDDSIVSPALVPGATGITDCKGRVEFRPFIVDSVIYSTLQVEDGATLQNPYAITDVEIRCNSQSATPSLSFSGTPSGGTLILQQFGILTQAATATQPGVSVTPATRLLLSLTQQSALVKEGFNDFTVPLFAVPATANLVLILLDASFVLNNSASGAGNVEVGFDNSSAAEFFPTATPPTFPGITGTYTKDDLSIFAGAVTGRALTTQTPGAVRAIDFAIGTAAVQVSVTSIPAAAIILRCQVTITTPYTAGTTIEVGELGSPNLLQDTPDNNPAVVDEYDSPQRTVWGGAAPVQVTIGGGPIAGAGFVTVEYTTPNP
jgi:hypothetical protein